jgi:molybdate transport system ATP-binding protein
MNPILTATLHKRFPGGPGIGVDDLRVGRGITVVFGASGSGKTTLLRCLAGLEHPESGRIVFEEEVWLDIKGRRYVPPRDRSVGFVPQDYGLFPHLTVAGNIGYGLTELSGSDRSARVSETVKLFGLDGLESRRRHELSGGQQQRVALARAVARRPSLLLLDEPLAALDTPTRLRVRADLHRFLRHLAIPTVLVTHDRFEAIALGDDVVVMHEGQVVQRGPLPEVFTKPGRLSVAEITAVETIQPGRILEVCGGLVAVAVGQTKVMALPKDLPEGAQEVYVCIRAEDVILVPPDAGPSSPRNRLAAVVTAVVREGPLVRVNLDCGFPLSALLTQPACDELGLQVGRQLVAMIKAPQVHLIPFGFQNTNGAG